MFSMQIFKFQRCSCKLSFLFPPCCQSAPDSLLAGYAIYHEIHEFLHKFYLNTQEKNMLLFATFETRRKLSKV